jgi:hypothetical protein
MLYRLFEPSILCMFDAEAPPVNVLEAKLYLGDI